MSTKNPIKTWAEGERPREKLLTKGMSSLSDVELLGIILSSGTRGRSAIDLARETLSLARNNLHELGRLGIQELCQVKGIGKARAMAVAASMELGRRRQLAEALNRRLITRSAEAADILIPQIRDLHYEVFCVLYLNQSNRLMHQEVISIGGMTGTVADIRIILKSALLHNANKLIIAHNHPSGNPRPSASDRELTRRLAQAAKIMDILLLDHLIVAGSTYTSLADEGGL